MRGWKWFSKETRSRSSTKVGPGCKADPCTGRHVTAPRTASHNAIETTSSPISTKFYTPVSSFKLHNGIPKDCVDGEDVPGPG